MKLKEIFKYLKPNERISITGEYGLIVDPIEFKEIKLMDAYEVLDDEILSVYYDKEDNSLTIELIIDDEDD